MDRGIKSRGFLATKAVSYTQGAVEAQGKGSVLATNLSGLERVAVSRLGRPRSGEAQHLKHGIDGNP